jgi:hypothetical protein
MDGDFLALAGAQAASASFIRRQPVCFSFRSSLRDEFLDAFTFKAPPVSS